MITSTTWGKLKKIAKKASVAVFWLITWQITADAIGLEILFVSPATVANALFSMAVTYDFWVTVFFTFFKIISGFALGAVCGVLLACFAYKSSIFKELITPLIVAVKATPVASFIILALLWISSANLSVFISFLMVLPTMYTSVYTGIISRDSKLLEMAKLYKVRPFENIVYVSFYQVFPYFISACSVSLGMSWKAGVAAEVIAIPSGSIGEELYRAKINVDTPAIFAWTIVIIVLSLLFEYLFMRVVLKLKKKLEAST